MSKRITLIAIVILMLAPLSCIPTSQDIQTVADGQQVLVSNMAELKTLVRDSGVIDQAKAEKLFTEAERVLSQGEQILVAIDGQEGIEMVKSGVKATAGWNPYAGWIMLGLNVAQGLGLFGLGKKNIDKGTALTELVAAVEPNKTEMLKTALIANTSTRTKALIVDIRKRVAA